MSRTVNLMGATATILGSPDPKNCVNFNNDTNCVGGLVAFEAYRRNFSNDAPSSVTCRLDRSTAFVQMHPLGWSVNRVAIHDILNYPFFTSTHAVLYLDDGADARVARQDLSGLQTPDFPLLLTNAIVPPSNSWYLATEAIYFDDATGLAIMSVTNSGQPMEDDQVTSTMGMLNYVQKLNVKNGCIPLDSIKGSNRYNYVTEYAPSSYTNITQPQCWVPIVWYGDTIKMYESFISNITQYRYPPALVVETLGMDERYLNQAGRMGNSTWVISILYDDTTFSNLRLSIENNITITKVENVTRNLMELPDELKDEQYYEHFNQFATLAQQATFNNPIVGNSTEMPITRIDNYRRCKAGECELGNLFTDALRNQTGADFAFITSGGIRGLGWPAGPVRLANLWESLPFPNIQCTGVMNGISMFRLFNYSTAISLFEAEDSNDGGNLLQVSGAKVIYNTELQGTRLVGLQIWNEEDQEYQDVERLKLYSFATDNFLCESNDPYPSLLRSELIAQGENPGTLKEILHQEIVADYLYELDDVYVTRIEGRLVNDTSITVPMNFLQSQEECNRGSYWFEELLSCIKCPPTDRVLFSDQLLELYTGSKSLEPIRSNITLYNNEEFDVTLLFKSVPDWIQISRLALNDTNEVMLDRNSEIAVPSFGFFTMDFIVNTSQLEPGTATGTVLLSIDNIENIPGCAGQDTSFDVSARIDPPLRLNQIGKIRNLGWILASIAGLTAVMCALWVLRHRDKKIVLAMQPIFLVTVCVGVFIMAMSIITVSIDDSIASARGCDIACETTPWLVSIGFSITFSALFSKLWRINRIFKTHDFRRKKVNEKDVLGPFAVLFFLNLTVLLVWTFVDPLVWQRKHYRNEPWNTYGVCRTKSNAGVIFMAIIGSINLIALALTCIQAYQARNISDDFSESKSVAIAVFSWLQLCVVGLPVLFLISSDNEEAKYYLVVFLIFAVCMSMLLFIFVPMILDLQAYLRHSKKSRRQLSVNGGNRHCTRADGMEYPRAVSVANKNNFDLLTSSRLESLRQYDSSVSDHGGRDRRDSYDIETTPNPECSTEIPQPFVLNKDKDIGTKRVSFGNDLESSVNCTESTNNSGNTDRGDGKTVVAGMSSVCESSSSTEVPPISQKDEDKCHESS